jgi:hypothetical protein
MLLLQLAKDISLKRIDSYKTLSGTVNLYVFSSDCLPVGCLKYLMFMGYAVE